MIDKYSKNKTSTKFQTYNVMKDIGFKKEFYQISRAKRAEATKKLWRALGITSSQAFWKYKMDRIEMRVSQYFAVKQVFKEYGIKY